MPQKALQNLRNTEEKYSLLFQSEQKEIRKYMKGKYTSEIENLRKVIKLSKELEM